MEIRITDDLARSLIEIAITNVTDMLKDAREHGEEALIRAAEDREDELWAEWRRLVNP